MDIDLFLFSAKFLSHQLQGGFLLGTMNLHVQTRQSDAFCQLLLQDAHGRIFRGKMATV
jgi:hypothetical protein